MSTAGAINLRAACLTADWISPVLVLVWYGVSVQEIVGIRRRKEC